MTTETVNRFLMTRIDNYLLPLNQVKNLQYSSVEYDSEKGFYLEILVPKTITENIPDNEFVFPMAYSPDKLTYMATVINSQLNRKGKLPLNDVFKVMIGNITELIALHPSYKNEFQIILKFEEGCDFEDKIKGLY